MSDMREMKEAVERALCQLLPAHWSVEPQLERAMYYSLLAGGKRLRPLLVLTATQAVGGDPRRALPVACAIECVHTYSLIHDDLPAMDDDDLRRGRPTNHKVFGEATAILAGDALLTHAFYLLATMTGVVPQTTVALVRLLAEYAGANGMVGGQSLDMCGHAQTVAQLDELHQRKTGDLIVCSLLMGGHMGGATSDQLEALESFGRAIGLAFQVQDDILDVTGDEHTLGKPLRSDEANQKSTYVSLAGYEHARQTVCTLTAHAQCTLRSQAFPHPQGLIDLAQMLMNRSH